MLSLSCAGVGLGLRDLRPPQALASGAVGVPPDFVVEACRWARGGV